jgi:hypothetical protein
MTGPRPSADHFAGSPIDQRLGEALDLAAADPWRSAGAAPAGRGADGAEEWIGKGMQP